MDLLVDHVYGGSRKGNASDDPLPELLGLDSGQVSVIWGNAQELIL